MTNLHIYTKDGFKDIPKWALGGLRIALWWSRGKIEWISAPAVKSSGMVASKMYEVVEVGEEKLVGEAIKHRKSHVQTVWSHSVRDDSMHEHPTIEIQCPRVRVPIDFFVALAA